jgi:phage terminase large subunit-like protein
VRETLADEGVRQVIGELIKERRELIETNQMLAYAPYGWQKDFHKSFDEEGNFARQRAVIAGNKTGKTYCGAMEMAVHLTGLYPDWWEGRRWNGPIKAWAAGNTITNTRDIVQTELLGEAGDPDDFGKGTIPRDLILGTERWPGIPNGFQQVRVKHVTGRTSTLYFKAYEQGKDAWMGKALDLIWLDEEPPQDIYSQALRASLKGAGSVYMTFTPEKGMTEVVAQFLNNLQPGQLLVRASWEDAPHLDEQTRAEILAAMPPHEREMRSKGIPVLGSGLVFPVSEDGIRVPAFRIPEHWARICGIDFGWDHPTAMVWIAWDRDTDKAYVYDCYKASAKTVVEHAATVKSRGQWIPVVWPHDGMQSDKGSGKPLAQQYREQGCEMLAEHFQNPGGGNAVEPGVQAMLTRMQTGTFFVFDHLTDWFTEFRQYHRQDGKIVKKYDDLMSATRYAVQSLRFARTLNFAPRVDKAEGTEEWEMFA